MSKICDQLVLGQRIALGSHVFTADEIMAFAREYDPQPFHTDLQAAKASHFGGLCASGWHSCAVWQRLNVAFFDRLAQEAGLPLAQVLGPSPGFQALKWLKPVYAGDTLHFSSVVSEKRPLESRPDWGMVSMLNEGVNQGGSLALSLVSHVFVRR